MASFLVTLLSNVMLLANLGFQTESGQNGRILRYRCGVLLLIALDAKKIKKCEKCAAYEKAAEELFEKEDLVRDDLHERGENK